MAEVRGIMSALTSDSDMPEAAKRAATVMQDTDGYLASLSRMTLAQSRLAVRLGPGHALTLAYVDLCTTIVRAKSNAPQPAEPQPGVTELVLDFAELAHAWTKRPLD
jgi:hypothetical protein